jgi:hypothetical protein
MAVKGDKTPSFAKTIGILWRTLVKDIADPYRPELHYMRGPGPKWREKHGMTAATAEAAMPGFAQVTA